MKRREFLHKSLALISGAFLLPAVIAAPADPTLDDVKSFLNEFQGDLPSVIKESHVILESDALRDLFKYAHSESLK